MATEPVSIGMFATWLKKAEENVETWGLQDTETLLLAMQEEMGEMTQAHLEATHEDGDPERLADEMDDLGALLLQLHMRLVRDANSLQNSDDDEVRTDGGEDEPTGTLILVDQTGRSLTWHHSVEFDGYVHTTACDRVIDCDDIRDVEMEHPREAWRKNVTPNNGCPTCHRSVHEDLDVRTDGGQVEACPYCDSPRINERVSDRYDDDERYRCVECHATFPDPVGRASRLPENRTYTDTYRALRDAGDLDDLRADGGVDMVDACPECDSPVITKHVGGMHRPIDDPPSYRCRDCKTLFDEPVQREPRRHVESVGNLSEAGRALLDADPDDFPIRTDGGTHFGHESSSKVSESDSADGVLRQFTFRLSRALRYWGLLKHPYGQAYARERYTMTGGESR